MRGRRSAPPSVGQVDVDVPKNSPAAHGVCGRTLPDGTECRTPVLIETDGFGGLVELEARRGSWVVHRCGAGPLRTERVSFAAPKPAVPKTSQAARLVPDGRGGQRFPAVVAPPPPNGTEPDHWGREIRRMRQQRGLSQQALATSLGVSGQRISQLEARRTPPVRNDLGARMERALGGLAITRPANTTAGVGERKAPLEVTGIARTLATQIQRRRAALGLSQSALADHAGDTTQGPIALIERGGCGSNIVRLERIAAVLGCAVADLFREE